ncbi:MAG: undecaprenyldiphospho-muramoylpentapeptide beta-N-acetylglucosaminyltransferase [Gammaproteobacteria bacterium]|nr:undecaprenyldiphospho-muramoylpentapeptide beta-N-acetylglucosaminyltransferase [Gammaproteobacteria bacterium]
MQTILFTGGGSAGHVTPNIALINKFLAAGWNVAYAGSKRGIEKDIIQHLKVSYYSIAAGKLRRYFSWRTFTEPFVILIGIIQAFFLCRKLKPNIIFSKGGFVAFPIVVGAWLNRIPVVIHESDLTPGLANKLSFPFASKICVTFEEGAAHITSRNIVVTGTPIRDSLLEGLPERGRNFCQFGSDPVLLVLGGGQGAAIINQTIRTILPKLLSTYQIAHICGKGKLDNNYNNDRYRQFEYLNDELADLFACSDLVISRAGANSLYELLKLRKPHILIPLSRRASRGDQIINAAYFAKRGLSNVLYEENLTGDSLLTMIQEVFSNKHELGQRLLDFTLPDSNQLIYKEIIQLTK